MCEVTPDVCCELALRPQSAGEAREFLRRAACVQHPSSLLDDATLLVSELVTNGIRYGGPPIRMTIECLADLGLRVSVTDGAGPDDSGDVEPAEPSQTSETDPRLVHAEPLAESGRGLRLVDHLSEGWGVRQDGDATTIWFELTPPGETPSGVTPEGAVGPVGLEPTTNGLKVRSSAN